MGLSVRDKAVKKLELAAIYAEDGALQTGVDLATEAIALLKKEQARRARLMAPKARRAEPWLHDNKRGKL